MLRTGGFVRRRRLLLPFAQEVQKAFTTQLERVGIPVAPPLPREAHVEICRQGREGETVSIKVVTSGAATIALTHNKNEQVQLRLESIVSISDGLSKAIEQLEARIASAKAESRNVQKFEHDLEELRTLGLLTSYFASSPNRVGSCS
jgi:hypothetical protein